MSGKALLSVLFLIVFVIIVAYLLKQVIILWRQNRAKAREVDRERQAWLQARKEVARIRDEKEQGKETKSQE